MSNNEILREFLLETHENLALLDSDLVALEKNPHDKNTLSQVFRTLHSVKGTAGFMGLVKLQAVAHAAESLLSRLRAGELQFNPPIASALLRVVDAVREMLASIEATGEEGAGDYSSVVADVDRLRELKAAEPSQSSASAPSSALAPPPVLETPSPSPETNSPPVGQALSEAPAPIVANSTPPALPLEPAGSISPAPILSSPPDTAASSVITPPPASSSSPPDLPVSEPAESRTPSVADASIRVDVGLLDKLMTLVGELVLARNQILQYSHTDEDSGRLGAVQRLNLLTTELQASVMKTRMQPIGAVLNKFPRVVRDLALACGKKVRFEMDGQETELDKTLLEAMRDPLTHMVRNAIDHGIESPEIRVAHGKPPEGRLRIVAFHEGGKVIIEITDDGGGIDVGRVRDKAVGARLVSPEAAARMSRQELMRLIFMPGFSTADRVTQFSGRGVGMDVVRTNIEKIGGTVDIESSPGQGTTIRTKIPLTLAILPALIVECGGERYAIPQVSLLELVRLESEQASRSIEHIQEATVYRLRGELLPLVFLSEQLQLESPDVGTQDVNIVVLQADDRPFGLVVDAIRDSEEIVVKPLQKQLKGVAVFAGAAVMGDGRVALVLDVLGLAQRAGVVSSAKRQVLGEVSRSAPEAVAAESLLLFCSSEGGRMAIPLSLVSRLEELPGDAVERLGARLVVQHRGEILPLIDVSHNLSQFHRSGRAAPPLDDGREAIPVVVCASGGERVGLIVGEILDIVHEPIARRFPPGRSGVLFSAIVQEHVTEFLDVEAIVRDAAAEALQGVN